ncbi:hypothetical protein HEP84_53335 [Streptomyces sp. RLB1-33]|nr:hypothetical protein [Streptomyces sp. RLB1-33]
MSENPQVKAILEHIGTRERELADQAEQFRARIEELTRQLGEIDAESENLRITQDPPPPPAALTRHRPGPPRHPGPPRLPADPDRPGRRGPADARPRLCQALDLPILPKNTEGIRSKLKRLVSRGILIEPEPGLFARPDA